MGEILEWIRGYIDQPILLFCAVFTLGWANVFIPPIPLESVTVFGSYLAGSSNDSAFLIWLAATSGMTIGSACMYWLAKSQGEKLLRIKWVRRYLPEKYIEKARYWFQKYEVWAIFLGKCIAGMSFAVVFCCGLFKQEQRRTLLAIFLANALYYGALVVVGNYVGLKWEIIMSFGWKIFIWMGGVLLLIAGLVLFVRSLLKKSNKGNSH